MAIAGLMFTTMTLIKNKDLIAKDALVYGMELHNFTSCQCTDQIGRTWESTEDGFIHRQGINPFINFSKFEVDNGAG